MVLMKGKARGDPTGESMCFLFSLSRTAVKERKFRFRDRVQQFKALDSLGQEPHRGIGNFT